MFYITQVGYFCYRHVLHISSTKQMIRKIYFSHTGLPKTL